MRHSFILSILLIINNSLSFAQDYTCDDFKGVKTYIDLELQFPNKIPTDTLDFASNDFFKIAGSCLIESFDFDEFNVPESLIENDPMLAILILISKSIGQDGEEEKQNWFNLTPLMNDMQIGKLYLILLKEKRKLYKIEKDKRRKSDLIEKYSELLGEDISSFQTKKVEECQWIKATNPDSLSEFEKCEYEMDVLYLENLYEKAMELEDIDKKNEILVDIFNYYEVFFLLKRKAYNPPYQKDFSILERLIYDLRIKNTNQQVENQSDMLRYCERYNLILEELVTELDRSFYVKNLGNSYGNMSWYSLFSEEFQNSENYAKKALELQPSKIWVKTNLGHALLFQNKYEEAIEVYNSIKELNDDGGSKKPFKEILLEDFEALENGGVYHIDIKRVMNMLNK